ncbi:MAG: class I SAM-dependent methyltransferase [Saccharofermentans sp.]|nr:class I SAM-dependent methyltransferase [Saccharofermentans sp.]
MFWDTASIAYDLVENIYNSKANNSVTDYVASLMDKDDKVLECACGTGMFSVKIAPKVCHLTATDFSYGMLKKAKKKLRKLDNVVFENADITSLRFEDGSFDKAVAANVIHLVDDPKTALSELRRVVKPGGLIIVPTYIHVGDSKAANVFNKAGAGFKRHFDSGSYPLFFMDLGISNAGFHICEGRMSCDVAVFRNI